MGSMGELTRRGLLCCCLCAAYAARSPAAVVVVVLGDRADRTVRAEGTKEDASVSRVGAGPESPGPGARSLVFVFQLPAAPPAAAAGPAPLVVTADLQFTVMTDRADGLYNIDLYALPARAASTVSQFDGFAGPTDGAATLIQDNIIPSVNSYTGAVHTDGTARGRLADYLNGVYGPTGAGAGQWVFLRLNPDASPPTDQVSGVDVAQANNAAGKTDAQKPTLSITFIPEPSAAGVMLAFGCGAGLTRRRRRPRRPASSPGRFPRGGR